MKLKNQSALGSLVANLINGNLTDAKRQAERQNFAAVVKALVDAGHSPNKARRGAAYLKNGLSFQAYCDEV